MVMRNAQICRSDQDVEFRITNVQSLDQGISVSQKSMNDRCEKVHENYFSCTLDFLFSYDLEYSVAGNVVIVPMKAVLKKLVDIDSEKKEIRQKLVKITQSGAKELGNGKVLKIDQTNSELLNQQVEISSKSVVDNILKSVGIIERLQNDTVMVAKEGLALKGVNDFKVNGICRNNNLCKDYNCQKIQKTYTVSVRQTKEFRGVYWFGSDAGNGYRCYKTWFAGCHAERWVNENRSKTEERDVNLCGSKVDTKFTVGKVYGAKMGTESLLNSCTANKCSLSAEMNFDIAAESGNRKDSINVNADAMIHFEVVDKDNELNWKDISVKEVSIDFTSKLSNAFFTKSSSAFATIKKGVEENLSSFAASNMASVMSSFHSDEFGSFNKTVESAGEGWEASEEGLVMDNEACASNLVCQKNCELVPSTEKYTEVLNKTVSEDNQESHENKGWECETTLNNVSRCADDVYSQMQNFTIKYKEERNPDVCFSNVSATVNMDSLIRVGALETLDLDSMCHSNMNGTTQEVLCQKIPASAKWNFKVSAGGNDREYAVESHVKMNVLVTISHDLNDEGDNSANYEIKQIENDEGVVSNQIQGESELKGMLNDDWFTGMQEIVRSKIRNEVFNAILEDGHIQDGVFKLNN